MFALAQLPSEYTIHLHTVAMFQVFLADAKLIPYNMAYLDEAPNLIERGNIFRLQAIDTVVQRISPTQQVPGPVNLAISCRLLQDKAFLVQSLETSYRPEERIPL